VTKPIIERWKQALKAYPEKKKAYDEEIARYEKMRKDGKASDRQKDPGNTGKAKGYAATNFDDAKWKTMKAPGQWEKTGADMNIDGVLWFRKEISLPETMAGKELTMTLGPIDDFDVTYWNGEKIGETTADTAQWWVHPRKYTIPADKVKAGRTIVAVRIFDHFGGGGFSGSDSQMALKTEDESGFLSLAGPWKYVIEHKQDPKALKPTRRPRPPMGPGNPWAPASLYNAMIHPLIQFRIKGAIWYQGESNAGRAVQYRTLMKAMINDWRRVWGQGDFPFFITQLANFRAAKPEPSEDSWAELREAQNMAMELPNVGVAVTIDIGDAGDIHPRNKQDVGKRLALSALKIAYGQDIVHSGPMYDSHAVKDGKIVLKFKSVGSGLVARGGKLKRFAIAGEDKKFVWAEAVIEGDSVVVSSPDVVKPAAVRYAWETNPAGCNLYNKEGLPASPFRTDDWPLSTEGKY
jgi:sialate O-acetylesterase